MKKIKLLMVCIACVLVSNKVNAQLTGIAINDDGSKADTSAILDVNVNSTTPKRGFLLPRITTIERDAIYHPAKGLLIYASDVDSIELNVGTALAPHWVTLGVGSSTTSLGWYTTGNSGTNSGTNFLGTIDNASLSIRTKSIERMLIDSLGRVGIGSSSFDATNPEKLLIDYGTTTSNTLANMRGSVNSYLQLNLQNQNSGVNASTDFVATADNGTDTTFYIDMGINSSTYTQSVENWGGPNDAYLYAYSKNLLLGTAKASTDIIFLLGGSATKTNTALRISAPSANVILGTGEATNTPIGNTLRGPNAKGTNIAGGSLTLQGGSATGTATGGSVNINGGNSVSGTGGSVNINASSNFATNINTGTSTSDVTIGGSSNNILLPKFTTVGGLIYTAANTGQLGGTTQLIWDNTNARLGIGTSTPLDKLHVVGNIRMVDGNQGAGKVLVSDANGTASWGSAGSLTVTNALSSSGNTITSTVNGVVATTNLVNAVSVNSAANTFSATVNGISGSGVNIINSNALLLSGTNLTSTVNGVASSPIDISSVVTSNAWSLIGNSGTTPGTNFIGTNDLKDFIAKTNGTERMRILSTGNIGIGTITPGSALDVKGTIRLSGSTSGYVGLQPAAAAGSTTYTLPAADGTSGQQLTTNGAGVLSWTNQTGTTTVSNTSSTNTLTTTVNGVTGTGVNIINSNALSLSGNTLTSTVNGVSATSNAVSGVSNTSSTNTLTTTVNGITGTGVNIINSNGLSLSGTSLTSTVNGVASSAIDISSAITSTAWNLTGNSGTTPGTNFIGTTDLKDFIAKTNGTERMRILSTGNIGIGTTTPGSAFDVKGTIRLSGSTSGYVGLQPAASAGSTTYTLPTADGTSGQQLTTNGAGILSWANQTGTTTVSNTSSTNTLTTTVNGVTGTGVNIINSNALSLTGGDNLVATINGVASTALDLTPAVIANAWSLTGNSGTTAGTNFIGTTDAIDFVTKTSNAERMRITSGGNVGIGLANPSYKLQVFAASNPLYLTGVQVGSVSTDSVLTISSGVVKKIAPLGNIVGLYKNQYSVTLPVISNNSGTTVTVPVSNAPYVAGGPNPVVQVNPSIDLPDGLIIAWSRVSATNTVSICFRNVTNQATSSQTIKFDVSIIQ